VALGIEAREIAASESHPIIGWLLTDARKLADPAEFVEAFALRLRRSGVDVARITVGVPILHPQLFSFSCLWQLGQGASERRHRADASQASALANSPIKIAYDGGGPSRYRLTDSPAQDEFPILTELRSEGFTDYVALSVPFSDGSHKALTLATACKEGFHDEEIEIFLAMIPAFAFNLEVQALRRTARTLLDTYVSRQSGGRVLDGQIRRGMGETIHAVIWLCDLRGFTDLSERLPRDALMALLNGYFGPMCEAVEANGGEVLKFIGDAMLAIFPVAGEPASACAKALAAAHTAEATFTAENARRLGASLPPIAYGLALHVGDVMYGNIGSDTRLDFTVIGPAVNLTARIEALCRELDRTLLLSGAFVRASHLPAHLLGEFALKGISTKQPIYAPSN
jgi:adenylate cyclase